MEKIEPSLRCINDFQNDRICDMCSITVPDSYKKCKKIYDKRVKVQKRKNEIEDGCNWRHILYNDCEAYWACEKPGHKGGSSCVAKEECTQIKNYGVPKKGN
jgi:hypothetical protein